MSDETLRERAKVYSSKVMKKFDYINSSMYDCVEQASIDSITEYINMSKDVILELACHLAEDELLRNNSDKSLDFLTEDIGDSLMYKEQYQEEYNTYYDKYYDKLIKFYL